MGVRAGPIGGRISRRSRMFVPEQTGVFRTAVLTASLAVLIATTLLQDLPSTRSARASVMASTPRTVGTIFSRPTLRDAIRIRLHVGEDHLRLNDARDYILVLPPVMKTGVLEIRG